MWPHVPDVNVDRRASAPLDDGVAWSGSLMTPAGRLLIRKMDEHLREKSTLDSSSKRASPLKTTPKTTPGATPVDGPRSALREDLA